MIEYIIKQAYARRCGGPRVLWNLFDGPPAGTPRVRAKRQVVCPVSSRSSSTSVPTIAPSTSTKPTLPSATINCHQPRGANAPSLAKIHSMLSDNNIFQQECSTKFPNNQRSLTFNNDFYFTTLETRGDFPLQYCNWGLGAILSSCIDSRGFYGGTYEQDLEFYNISDSV